MIALPEKGTDGTLVLDADTDGLLVGACGGWVVMGRLETGAVETLGGLPILLGITGVLVIGVGEWESWCGTCGMLLIVAGSTVLGDSLGDS